MSRWLLSQNGLFAGTAPAQRETILVDDRSFARACPCLRVGQTRRGAVRLGPAVRDGGPTALLSHDHQPLIDYESLGPDAKLSIPTPEHYLPLLYVAAGCHDDEQVTFPVEGIDGGSVSMLAVQIG